MNESFMLILTYAPKRITTAALGAAVVFAPITVSAADSHIKKILTNTQDLLNILLEIVMTLAFVVFIWGIVKFIAASGSTQKITQAKGIMYYGIIGLAVMAMITGIIAFLQNYFGIQSGIPITVPQFPMHNNLNL